MSKFENMTSPQWVQDVYGQYGIQDLSRLQYPSEGSPIDLEDAIIDRRESDNGFVVLADGAFDVPHPAHERFLRHVRVLAGAALLAEHSYNFGPSEVRRVIGGNAVTLVATVDADSKVAYKKGGKLEKGGSQRPVYPWIARAERVLGYTFDTGQNHFRPVVDIATVEGDERHQGTPFESSMSLAGHLHRSGLLDTVVLSEEHTLMIEEAKDEGLDPIVIPISSRSGPINPQTGDSWSSSGVIGRIKGQPVQNPITRPEHLFQPINHSSR